MKHQIYTEVSLLELVFVRIDTRIISIFSFSNFLCMVPIMAELLANFWWHWNVFHHNLTKFVFIQLNTIAQKSMKSIKTINTKSRNKVRAGFGWDVHVRSSHVNGWWMIIFWIKIHCLISDIFCILIYKCLILLL